MELSDRNVTTQGVLILTQLSNNFYIHWGPLDGSPSHRITAVFENQPKVDFKTNEWKYGLPLNVDCSLIDYCYLEENPLSITFVGRENTDEIPQKRKFSINPTEFSSLSEFVSNLIINAIAVPSNEHPYSLYFYSKCHSGVYFYTPPYIQIEIEQYTTLENFWTSVHTFFEKLIIHLDESDTLPKDPAFPFALAARAAHKRVFAKIDKYTENLPKYTQITDADWDELFDSEGRIKDPESFKQRVYLAGVTDDVLCRLLPFVFGVYDLRTTAEERQKIDNDNSKEYHTLVAQIHNIQNQQLDANRKLSQSFRVIQHDIQRTDRGLSAFKEADGPGLLMLTELLQAYCIYNPPLSYLQGMNDLFVPIILSYLPRWTDDGQPVGPDGKPADVEAVKPAVFWCFDRMLRNTGHLPFLQSVTEQCGRVAAEVQMIIARVSPLAAIWLHRNGLSELLWCYSEFVLLFKRSFDYIWTVWLQLNAAPNPTRWFTYFVTAVIMAAFDDMSRMKEVTVPNIMSVFPSIMAKLDHKRLGEISLWVAEQFPLEPAPEPERGRPWEDYELYESAWK